MYNRYIPNDQGTYTRIPQEVDAVRHSSSPSHNSTAGRASHLGGPEQTAPPGSGSQPGDSPPTGDSPPPEGTSHASPPPPRREAERVGHSADGITGILRHLLDQFHLDSVDTGDLLLLGLLFFLFREDADEELLVALGLLLIL